ncbi:uncharacterized protein Bfra_011307 [Botrytis fragariae]|uniref:Uncharacterized protein n=1 Tax=Botrytis fragariae TaxID=1964551 RepID=A0A8H6AKP5_9HELO|nr:uncharacterized protein Bfra_011307 [Botrytis fragariae]KAF5869498.1 hypothetical protein Bfra_011307 [Botrytis fragariae]
MKRLEKSENQCITKVESSAHEALEARHAIALVADLANVVIRNGRFSNFMQRRRRLGLVQRLVFLIGRYGDKISTVVFVNAMPCYAGSTIDLPSVHMCHCVVVVLDGVLLCTGDWCCLHIHEILMTQAQAPTSKQA